VAVGQVAEGGTGGVVKGPPRGDDRPAGDRPWRNKDRPRRDTTGDTSHSLKTGLANWDAGSAAITPSRTGSADRWERIARFLREGRHRSVRPARRPRGPAAGCGKALQPTAKTVLSGGTINTAAGELNL